MVQSQNSRRTSFLSRQTSGSSRLSRFLEHKLAFLMVFAIIYGLVFINYIDVNMPGARIDGYHLWLVLMYFLPFAPLSVINIKYWKLTVGLGLVASLMNDVFYGLIRSVMTGNYNLGTYYSNWLIPRDTVLFELNLGFAIIQVQSWMMATSIYLRFAAVFVFLEGWKYLAPNMHVPASLSLKKPRIGNSKSKTPKTEI